jgi:hypothetical protein
MGFIIESSDKQALIQVTLHDTINRGDGLCIKMSVSQLLANRKKNRSLYITLNLEDVQVETSLVSLFTQFAELYHQWRKDFQLELLIVLDPVLMPTVRYLSESLFVPMLFFASPEALDAYIDKRTGDTQPFRPDWARNLVQTLPVED